jgi:hypothetical protein
MDYPTRKVAICPKCGLHLGWIFRREHSVPAALSVSSPLDVFYGLILPTLHHQSASSWLVESEQTIVALANSSVTGA